VRLGRPSSHFFDDLQPAVASAVEGALSAMQDAGATVVEIDLSEELAAVVDLRVSIVPREFVRSCFSAAGDDDDADADDGKADQRRRARWAEAVPLMGANVHRNSGGLDVTQSEYERALAEVRLLQERVAARMKDAGIEALVAPTVP
jgi:Asp-tRNA(Asn)/Glu-tRNA(Gln) amidotransferase A subunit family amidase